MPKFDLGSFLPYLLNQAAEAVSKDFQKVYRTEHGLTRTQWRVLANLAWFGDMTATRIRQVSHEDKPNVSRAVSALEKRGLLVRRKNGSDRRIENLALTAEGQVLVDRLGAYASGYDAELRSVLGAQESAELERLLSRLAALRNRDGS